MLSTTHPLNLNHLLQFHVHLRNLLLLLLQGLLQRTAPLPLDL